MQTWKDTPYTVGPPPMLWLNKEGKFTVSSKNTDWAFFCNKKEKVAVFCFERKFLQLFSQHKTKTELFEPPT